MLRDAYVALGLIFHMLTQFTFIGSAQATEISPPEALIDRLTHKAHIMDISREKGGRFEETVAWLDSKR